MPKDIYEIGDIPPLGVVPKWMYASIIRPERYGQPLKAFQVERLQVPPVGPHDALVLVMAAGVNYNNIWAALGTPVDTCKLHAQYGEPSDFHVGGSDASGIVYAVGDKVQNLKVGDHVVIHCGRWDVTLPEHELGEDQTLHRSFHIWGYESNWGSFAQFTRVQAQQCMPKAEHLTWEEAAAPTLVGATVYRMLYGWPPHTVRAGDPILVWGGGGGVGVMAIQLAAAAGARPVAVVSSEERARYCLSMGAVGTIDRRPFKHWGMLPHWTDQAAFAQWMQGAKAFGQAFWQALGAKQSPTLVIEHPGEDTIPTSMFVCAPNGMVVICAGTTGYNAVVDLRYLWMRQKRLQGSHFANLAQSRAFNDLVRAGKISPALSRTFPFQELPLAHQQMFENQHPAGNMAVLINAPRPGLRGLPE